MKKLFFILPILSALLIIIFQFCTDPDNPFENIDKVDVLLTVPNKPDSFLWNVLDSIPIEVALKYASLIDSIKIEFGEDDSILVINIGAMSVPDNATLQYGFKYQTEGMKTIKCTAYLPSDETPAKNVSVQLNIGKKPVLSNNKKIQRPPNAYIDSLFIMYVTSEGTAPLAFYWYKNETIISRAINDTLKFDTLSPADSGIYFCVVKNNWGVDTSKTDTLKPTGFITGAKIVQEPVMQTVQEGQTASFSITATGTPPLSYQWQKDSVDIPGATTASYTTPATTMADSGSLFRCITSNAASSDTSDEALLKVNRNPVKPLITTEPVLQSVTEGQTASFTVTASGTAPLLYQWQKNSANISGATSASYTTPATTMADSGALFKCIVSNSVGADTSIDALLKVSKLPVKPTITTEPVQQSVSEGQTASFSVTATGTTPLSYQWQKNSANISGANAASYTTPATVMADSGALFKCIVSNSVGADTSIDALLKVSKLPVKPTITTEPVQQSVSEGQTASFSVTATGTTPLTYQWQKNSANISGANAVSYTTPATVMADSGALFRCIASNSVGADSSATALLKVNRQPVKPTITTEPVQQSVTEGQTASFSVTATGTTPLTYQWQKNSANISGANAASYTTPATVMADSGALFRCIVSNSVGADTSATALLKVNKLPVKPTITTEPVQQSVIEGQTATFSITATGTTPLSYQWQKNNVNISSATSTSYTTPATTMTDSGSLFRCIVSNSVGNDTSDNARLTVTMKAPVITVDPTNQSVIEGSTATFSITATGTSINLQWQKNNANISGATAASYSTPATVMADHNATFRCIASNTGGKDTSAAATLTVTMKKPEITADPSNTSAIEGSTASFLITAIGTSVTYQWQKNNANIASGATDASYTTPATTMADHNATFRCIASNAGGKDTSAAATLTVTMKAPVITSSPANRIVNEGQTATFYVSATGTSLHYEWQKDGAAISGAPDQDSYTLTTTWQDNAKTFRCRVYNAGGSVNSGAADLTVYYAPKFTVQPVSQSPRIDANVTFTASAAGNTASGTGATYQWYFGSTAIAGATSSSYTVSAIEPRDGGTYHVKATNSIGTTSSSNATLTVVMEFLDPRDNKVYKIVNINDTLWFGENIRYAIAHNPNGDSSWLYPSDPNGTKYGRYYNESAVSKAIPSGWYPHPHFVLRFTEAEVKAEPPTWNGTDNYNLHLVPAGMRNEDGTWPDEPMDFAGFWNDSGGNFILCKILTSGNGT